MMRQQKKVNVVEKEVFGSLIAEDSYGDDRLLDVRDWIDCLLEKIPREHRDEARIDVDSIGGYEGEHHVEICVYYMRPETDVEMAGREHEEQRRRDQQLDSERATYEKLKAKYGS